jgi:hypothetical protein
VKPNKAISNLHGLVCGCVSDVYVLVLFLKLMLLNLLRNLIGQRDALLPVDFGTRV